MRHKLTFHATGVFDGIPRSSLLPIIFDFLKGCHAMWLQRGSAVALVPCYAVSSSLADFQGGWRATGGGR